MANLFNRAWLTLTGKATYHKYTGDGSDVDPAIPHVVVESLPQATGQYLASITGSKIQMTGVNTASVASTSTTRTLLSFTNTTGGPVHFGITGMAYGTTADTFLYTLSAGQTLVVPQALTRLAWTAYSTATVTIYKVEG